MQIRSNARTLDILPSPPQLSRLPFHEDTCLHLDITPFDQLAVSISRQGLKYHRFHGRHHLAVRVIFSRTDLSLQRPFQATGHFDGQNIRRLGRFR